MRGKGRQLWCICLHQQAKAGSGRLNWDPAQQFKLKWSRTCVACGENTASKKRNLPGRTVMVKNSIDPASRHHVAGGTDCRPTRVLFLAQTIVRVHRKTPYSTDRRVVKVCIRASLLDGQRTSLYIPAQTREPACAILFQVTSTVVLPLFETCEPGVTALIAWVFVAAA